MRNVYIAEWIFLNHIKPSKVPILLNGEQALFAFQTRASTAIFTNARIVSSEASSKEMNIFSLPYKNIQMWQSSTTNNTTIYEIYTMAGIVKITLKKDIDPIKFDRILATLVMGSKK